MTYDNTSTSPRIVGGFMGGLYMLSYMHDIRIDETEILECLFQIIYVLKMQLLKIGNLRLCG